MPPLTIIEPQKSFRLLDLKELYYFRELLRTFIIRDLKVRYRQTVIGGAWAILQPFITMVIFSFFFGKIAKIPSEGVPYPIFSYSGLILWTYFSNAISMSANSMIGGAGLISKVYFPRIILPISSTLIGLVDYLIAFCIFFGLVFYYHLSLNPYLLILPLILVFTWFLATGIGFWLSALNVRYRDVQFVLPFFIQLLVFITPVIYPTSVAGNYKWIIMLNPLTGLIEAHRAILLNQPINFELLSISLFLSIIVLITGMIYFKSVERFFVDVI